MKAHLLFLLILSQYMLYSQDEVSFVREARYSKIVMSIDDLNKIIEEINYYIPPDTSTDEIAKIFRRSSIIISNTNRSLTYNKFVTIPQNVTEREIFTSFDLEYRGYKKPISDIKIDFHDYNRTLRISGNDQRKVEDLFHGLDEKFGEHIPFLGWIDFRFISFLLLILIITFLAGALYTGIAMPIKPTSVIIFLWIGAPMLLLLLWFFGGFLTDNYYSGFFPRFILKTEITSWIDRNANNMEFIGFVALIISTLYWFYNKYIKSKEGQEIQGISKNED